MPIEQRVVSSPGKIAPKNPSGKIGAKAATPAEEEAAPKSKKKLLIIVLAAVLVLGGGAAWYFLMGPGHATEGEAHAEPEPEPGAVLTVEPISVNLAAGHYLRIGLGLQMTIDAGGHGEPDPSKAVDLMIAKFSGRDMAAVSDPATRDALKAELLAEIEEAYHGEVMDLYLTNYVTQ
ncbi:flagellar basal body-associated FliL family protein [Cellulomonas sp. NS3]|uniref:flagellar basal body-associated FliL family protein n=1 Tax=Cellulomonas sp. NS3 TaxID=2973977 RepID=UPI002162D2A6|nr:flagellar basal body-associated FliL family protein [Cellulomonas sp. NS3]